MYNTLLYGYAVKNVGDDLFFYILANRYPNVQFYIESDYYKTGQLSNNLHFISKKESLFRQILRRFLTKIVGYCVFFNKRLLQFEFDNIVFIGGSIFIEHQYPFYYYDKYLNQHEFFAGKPINILGCNYGPARTAVFLNSVYHFLEKTKDVCFRDSKSFNLFKDIPHCRVEKDVVFCYKKERINKEVNCIGISVIDLANRDYPEEIKKIYVDSITSFVQKYLKKGYSFKLFSFCENEGDLKVCNELLERIKSPKVTIVNYDGDLNSFVEVFISCSMIIATRFHACVLALTHQISLLPIIYSSKTTNMLDDVGFCGKMVRMDECDKLCTMNIESLDNNILQDLDLKAITESAERQFKYLDKYYS